MAEIEYFSVNRKQSLFSGKARCSMELKIQLAAHELTLLLAKFLPKISMLCADRSLTNLKGRDKGQSADPKGKSSSANKDEILYLSGDILNSTEGFSFSIHSPFDSFPSHGSISHKLELQQHPRLPSPIPWSAYGVLAPLQPKKFRFALQEFRPLFGGSLFGLTPAVSDELLVDVLGDKLILLASARKMGKDDLFPLRKTHLTKALLETLSTFCTRDLVADALPS